MNDDTAVIRCAEPDCDGRLRVLLEHVPNLLAAGWRCPGPHTREDHCQ